MSKRIEATRRDSAVSAALSAIASRHGVQEALRGGTGTSGGTGDVSNRYDENNNYLPSNPVDEDDFWLCGDMVGSKPI